jgi:head-tail adaptor
MNAGELRDRIVVKRLSNSADGYGGFTSSVSTVATVWAKLKFTDGDVDMENSKRVLNKGIELKIRKNTATDNIQKGDLLFPERDNNEYSINGILELDLNYFKIIGNRTA